MSAQRASFDDYLEAISADQMRQLHDRKVGLLITGSLILGMMAAGGPAYAASSGSDELDLPPLTATSSEDVPDEYLVYPDGTPLPADALVMKDAEMNALGSDTDISTPDSTPGATARATVAGNCHFAVGFPTSGLARSQLFLVVGERQQRRSSGQSSSCTMGGFGLL